jgi:hypothetical protein
VKAARGGLTLADVGEWSTYDCGHDVVARSAALADGSEDVLAAVYGPGSNDPTLFGWRVWAPGSPAHLPLASGPETGALGRAAADAALARLLAPSPAWSAEVEAEAGGEARREAHAYNPSPDDGPDLLSGCSRDDCYAERAKLSAALPCPVPYLIAALLDGDDLVTGLEAEDLKPAREWLTGVLGERDRFKMDATRRRALIQYADKRIADLTAERDRALASAERATAAAEEAAALVAQAQDKTERALTAGEAIAARLAAAEERAAKAEGALESLRSFDLDRLVLLAIWCDQHDQRFPTEMADEVAAASRAGKAAPPDAYAQDDLRALVRALRAALRGSRP